MCPGFESLIRHQPLFPDRTLAQRLLTLLFGLLLAMAATAQGMRTIPADAPRGKLVAIELGAVNIDGRLFRFSPGARILNANNLTVTPNLVTPEVPVRYQLDGQGQIRTLWILSADEARRR